MKQVFYTGLLALTIAFSVTSCDKNELPDAPAVGVVVNDEYSKVSFGEAIGIAAPKGEASASASKNAADFVGSHIFATSEQVLEISKDDVVVYTGSYTAGNISDLDPSSIILANGNYSALSSNVDNVGLGLVSGFAPYTSSMDFELSATANIQLVVDHQRGFVIADAERAIEGGRITSVVLSSGDLSGNLILDESDGNNDFYGYLVGGTYQVVINYTKDGANATKSGSVLITNGVASTLRPVLEADAPSVSSDTTTSTQSGFEGTAEDRPSGDSNDYDVYSIGNQNGDDDMVDSYTRLVSSTIITTGGVPAAATVVSSTWAIDVNASGVTAGEDSSHGQFIPATYSDWAPAYDNNITDFTQTRSISNSEAGIDPAAEHDLERIVVISSEGGVESQLEGTEAGIGRNINPGTEAGQDDDMLDTLVRTITSDLVHTASFGLGSYTVSTDPGAWSIVINNDEAITYDVREYSAYGPVWETQLEDFTQTRSVSNADGSTFDPQVAVGELSRVIAVASSITTPATAGVAGVRTYTATIDSVDVFHEVAIDALPEEEVVIPAGTVTASFSGGGVVWDNSGSIVSVVAPDGSSASVDGLVITFSGAGQYTLNVTNALGNTAVRTFTIADGSAADAAYALTIAASSDDVSFGG